MLGGLTLFTLASIASALSTSSGALIAARAVQGLGAAAVMPLSLTLLAAAVPGGDAPGRDRHLGRRLRPRCRPRPGRRRRRRRGRQLAGDLLAERAGRARRGAAAVVRGPRVLRPPAAARPARHPDARRRGLPRHLGHRARQRRRLDLGRCAGPAGRGRAAGPGVRRCTPGAAPTRCCRCGCSAPAGSRSPT